MPALGSLLTAMVTPFDAQGRVDETAAVRLMHHLVEHGSDGLVIGGSSGEASTLSDEEMGRLFALAVEEVGSKATIVAGTGSNDTRHSLHLTELATAAGVDGTLNVVGYYNRPNRRGIVAHYCELSRATDKPIVVYNIPSRTTLDISNDLLAELAQLDHVDALKQANPEHLAMVDGLDLYAGNDDMLADVVALGGARAASASPPTSPATRCAAWSTSPTAPREIHDRLLDLFESLGVTTNPIPVKAALRLLGLDCGGLRLPLVEADEAETDRVRGALDALGLLSAAGAA